MRYMAILAGISLLLAVTATAGATSIRDRAEYRPSSDLALGTYAAGQGYQMPGEFQLNLEYQTGIPDAEIEAFNNYFLDKTPPELNFPDGDYYYLRVDCSGKLPIGIWDYNSDPMAQEYAPDSEEDWVQWTMSYWYTSGGQDYLHTVLAGDIVTSGSDSFLRVLPSTGFRSFVGDATANYVEVFEGETVLSEVLGYHTSQTCSDLMAGTATGTLEAELVPEPVTLAGLMLGIGCLARYVRKRR
ncbi:MAG TPA: PEP-CTERM sorting domain-containing protein [Phycisphaerae bacterium]|nr:PEP-CTERM sorting domain-containing protein [Phycisphaerae bacterium]